MAAAQASDEGGMITPSRDEHIQTAGAIWEVFELLS